MNLFSLFNFEKKAAFSLTDASFWERFGLSRKNTFRYGRNNLLEAYAASELVYACINKIADVMNDAEIIVERKNAEGEWELVPGHRLQALFKRPNNFETGRQFRRLMVQSEQISGIFYAEIVRSPAGLPVQLHPLNPNRVRPVVSRSTDEIEYYEYTRASGKQYKIRPEDMLIRRRVDLTDRFYGLSPLRVALKSVNSDLGFTDYVDAFFESDGTPSGILKVLNKTLKEAEAEALSAKWAKKFSRGGSNQKGTAVLDQNAEYQRVGANLNELAADSVGDRFEARICAAFGVPPNLVGANVGLRHVTANATAKAELRNFWDNKISPELAELREWLTWFVLPEFEDYERIAAEQIRVGFDISQAAFLQEDLNDIHARARANYSAGLWTLNEAREETGKMPREDETGDMLRAEQVAALKPKPEPQAEPAQLTDGKTLQIEPKTTENGNHITISEKKTFDLDGLTLSREPRGVELLIDLKSIVSDLENNKEKILAVLAAFRDELIEQAARELDKLDVSEVYKLVLTPDQKTRKRVLAALQSAYKTGREQIRRELEAQRGGKSANNFEIKKEGIPDDDFIEQLSDTLIARLVNEIQSRAVNWFVALKTLGNYAAELLKEKLLGESTKFVELAASNSLNAAIKLGRDAEIEAQSENWKYLEYSAILDSRVCGPCKAADGQTAQSLEELPDAPNPDCEGGANCRCFIVCVSVDEE